MSDWADAFSVLSGTVVVLGALYGLWEYSIQRWRRRRRLINHLRLEADRGLDQGQRTTIQLMRNLRMTEQQVMDAGFGTRRIQPLVSIDPENGHAKTILFQYVPLRRRGLLRRLAGTEPRSDEVRSSVGERPDEVEIS